VHQSVNRLDQHEALLLVVDVQGKLARLVHDSDAVIKRLQILVEGCQILGVPTIWAEQLPEKLGTTVPELTAKLGGLTPHIKSSFGCCEDSQLYDAIRSTERRQVILCGIETHVCVWQTAVVLLGDDFQVHLIADATSSRSMANRDIAINRMVQEGVHLSCVEMALFEMMRDAEHPQFRAVTKLLK
jgi:nicotinamidase-related amidase